MKAIIKETLYFSANVSILKGEEVDIVTDISAIKDELPVKYQGFMYWIPALYLEITKTKDLSWEEMIANWNKFNEHRTPSNYLPLPAYLKDNYTFNKI